MAAGGRKAVHFDIDANDPTVRHRLGQTYCDRRLTAAAIEHRHIGPKVRQKKAGIDIRAAGLDRGLNPASSLGSFHRNRPRNRGSSLSLAEPLSNRSSKLLSVRAPMAGAAAAVAGRDF